MTSYILVIVVSLYGSQPTAPQPIGTFASLEACTAAGAQLVTAIDQARKADGVTGKKAVLPLCLPTELPKAQ